ncbi:N-acetylhexosaminidase [Guyanagaster necrorhizus]|uniref:Beta-hexosaminidase n=1 Tax=Guyanagaster necrorhizus TaxID=856835 RepID=A0A9P7VPB1_9AGAR|nr:N-acetylhexosaminidase [Guyanagaster necrorhizus MCA 3950]KAG7444220.1 N-acetylhexosaminidase [Guyanagaster necrorhizus MCA 3950]
MLYRLLILLFAALRVSALWPLPQSISTGSTYLQLSTTFDITLSGIYSPPADLTDAISRTKQYLFNDKLQRLVVGRGANNADVITSAASLKKLTLVFQGIEVSSISEEAVAELESRVESYTLKIPADGSDAIVTANSTLGLFRGLTTFSQLWYDWEDTIYTPEAPVDIIDAPAYPYRGLMLDTARNFFPVLDLKRTLDAMSWVKMSTFHWHVTDSQSFPLEVAEFPDLSAKGAYSSSMTYTTSDIEDIVAHAASRGIDVLVEFDTPGHTGIIAEAYPDHVACAGATPWQNYANELPAGQLRIASSDTVNFTASLVSAISSMFPSKYFSTGGDEINFNCYDDDNVTQADLAAKGVTITQALNSFTESTHGALHVAGKTPVVWEEMVLDYNITTLGNDTIVMVWVSSDDAAAVAEKGYKFVHAASDYFYLDCGAGEMLGNTVDETSWCDPFKTWQKAYSFDPTANLTEEQGLLVLGGQHLLWTEQSSPSNLDPIVWPRAAASAEVFWSGSGRNVSEALPRLHDVRFRFNQRGVGAIALQPFWCAIRPGLCVA